MKGTAPMDLVHAGTDLRGFVAAPSGGGEVPFPTVMVMHSGLGLRHNLQDKLQKLNERGYLAVATDMYGVGAHDHGEEAAGAHYQALSENPALLRERTVAWFDAIAARPDVDAARMAAIGYCFGGLCVLELARSGADAKAVVSYHGILTTHAPASVSSLRRAEMSSIGAYGSLAPQ
jgi:dienelactone hydrolase